MPTRFLEWAACIFSSRTSKTMNRIIWAILAIGSSLWFPQTLFTQEYIIGVVVDAHTEVPIPGATIRWLHHAKGAITAHDGTFRLERVPSLDSIVVAMLGYDRDTVLISGDSLIITLRPTKARTVEVSEYASGITSADTKTERISARDLTKAACCSLAESFEKSPTVEVSYSDAVSGARQIQLLGLRGTYTQILTEAVPSIRGLETPYGLDHIPGPFMESISISKGAATVTNGYESMTGQINIEYRKPMSSEPLFVNLYGNSLGRSELNVTAAQVLSSELATMTMVHGRLFQGSVDQNSDGFLDMPQFSQVNALHRWWYNDDDIEVQVLGRAVVDDYAGGQQGVSLANARSSLSRYDIRTDIERYEGFVKIGLLGVIESVEGSSAALIVNGASHSMGSFFGLRSYEGSQRTLNARAVLALPFSDEISVIGGFSWLADRTNEAAVGIGYQRSESVPGFFAEATVKPMSSVSLIGGLRADRHNLYGTYVVPRLHLRWTMADMTTLRASAGRGWRVPTILAENLSTLITSMPPVATEAQRPEISWNYGVSLTHGLEIFGRPITLDAEVYHTEFQNQLLADFDLQPGRVVFRNTMFTGIRSYATSIMLQAFIAILPRLDVNVAYRWVDNQAAFGESLQQRPMFSRERLLITASFAAEGDQWQFDVTFSHNGGGRLPSTAHMPQNLRRGESFPGFSRLNGQVQRRFNAFDLYLGIENATNFFQQDPVLGADAPFGPHFDASMAWGPTDARMVYAGIRYRLGEAP